MANPFCRSKPEDIYIIGIFRKYYLNVSGLVLHDTLSEKNKYNTNENVSHDHYQAIK